MLAGKSLSVRGVVVFLLQFSSIHLLKRSSSAAALLLLVTMSLPAVSRSEAGTGPGRAAQNLPLSFEENRGQADKAFRYVLRYNGSEALFSPGGVDFRPTGLKLQGGSIRMRLVGAQASPEGKDLLGGRSNYMIGADASKWIRGVPHFRLIKYNDLYPGISLAFYGNGDALEHDFQLEPGADPSRISFRFDGAEGVSKCAPPAVRSRYASRQPIKRLQMDARRWMPDLCLGRMAPSASVWELTIARAHW
jgi:hypothetical protein